MIVPLDRADTPAAALVRAWLRLYTFAAEPPQRERREQQIESDLWEQQAAAAERSLGGPRLALAIGGRMLRGMPSDIAWRTNTGGFAVNIRIPFNRMAGLLLLSLVILVPVASSISGYDTSRDSWPNELTRLGRMEEYQTTGNVIFQVLAGVALLGAAAGFGTLLARRARVAGTIAAVFLAGAGVLTLISSALYQATAEMAHTYASEGGDASLVTTSRAVALVMDNTVTGATVCLVLAVFVLAVVAARERLVPRWLTVLPLLSVVAMPAYVVLSAISDGAAWGAIGLSFTLLIAWLLVAGLMMLFGSSDRGKAPVVPAAA